MLGRPRAVRVVWVSNSADIDVPQPNYRLLHWRNPHMNGVGFAELNDYDIRAWLLSNPVLEDPLDPLVYCHRRYTADRVPTPPLRRNNYLPENDIADWVPQAGARTGIQAPRKEVRPDPSQCWR